MISSFNLLILKSKGNRNHYLIGFIGFQFYVGECLVGSTEQSQSRNPQHLQIMKLPLNPKCRAARLISLEAKPSILGSSILCIMCCDLRI